MIKFNYLIYVKKNIYIYVNDFKKVSRFGLIERWLSWISLMIDFVCYFVMLMNLFSWISEVYFIVIFFGNLLLRPPPAVHAHSNEKFWKRTFSPLWTRETLRDRFLMSSGREKSQFIPVTLRHRLFFNTPSGTPYKFKKRM